MSSSVNTVIILTPRFGLRHAVRSTRQYSQRVISRTSFRASSITSSIFTRNSLLLWQHGVYSPRIIVSCFLATDSPINHTSARSQKESNSLSLHGRIISRPLDTSPVLSGPKTAIGESKSTVEQAIESIKAKKSKTSVDKTEVVAKKSVWERVKHEALHYYNGFKLLFYDVKISSRLLWKSMKGQTLTRRERKQFIRTVSDLFRLVPFSVFIIVPFMEFLLPVVLAIFPSMLPSTFQTTIKKKERKQKELKVKLEMAKFLQETVEEMAVESKTGKRQQVVTDLAKFFEKVRTTGEEIATDDLLQFSKLFEDELTLDNLTRPQLIALCKLLLLQPVGTSNFLRFQLKLKLRHLEADDRLIMKEGVASLTKSELQAACQARGMRAIGMSEHRLRSQLSQWLDLHLKEQVPTSLLLLSRALYLPEKLPPEDQLKVVLSTLPEEMVEEAEIKAKDIEGAAVDNRKRLEVVMKQEERIKEEEEEEKTKEIKKEEAKSATTAEQEELKDVAPVLTPSVGVAVLSASSVETSADEVVLSKEDLRDISDVVSSLKKPLSGEEISLEELKEDREEFQSDVADLKAECSSVSPDEQLEESVSASRVGRRVDHMINEIDSTLKQLRQQVEEQDTTVAVGDIVTTKDLANAIRITKKTSDEKKIQRICEVLDDDKDGSLRVNDVIKVIELIAREDTDLKAAQVSSMMALLKKENQVNTKSLQGKSP